MDSKHVQKPVHDYIRLFLQSREAIGCSESTMSFYRERLTRFTESVFVYWRASQHEVERYLNSISPNQYGLSTRHCSYRVLRTFYRWLENQYGLPNPTANLRAPILGKPILPSLNREQIQYLLDSAECVRDRAIIATLTESGLRLSELANIKASDIDWQAKTVRTIGKGRKEAYAPFGGLSETYLREWLSEYRPNGNIWGLNYWGITQMLKRLERQTGLKCNPHVFRRSFAVLLRKAGVDCLVIRDLGRWESVQMVERYTRSFNFSDAMKFYKGTLGD
jgi:site-specific recombinase XerD